MLPKETEVNTQFVDNFCRRKSCKPFISFYQNLTGDEAYVRSHLKFQWIVNAKVFGFPGFADIVF